MPQRKATADSRAGAQRHAYTIATGGVGAAAARDKAKRQTWPGDAQEPPQADSQTAVETEKEPPHAG